MVELLGEMTRFKSQCNFGNFTLHIKIETVLSIKKFLSYFTFF